MRCRGCRSVAAGSQAGDEGTNQDRSNPSERLHRRLLKCRWEVTARGVCQGKSTWRNRNGSHRRLELGVWEGLLWGRSVQTWCRGLTAIARRVAAATTQQYCERSYGLSAALAQRATARGSPPPPARRLAARAARRSE